jgi:hypothetical protein
MNVSGCEQTVKAMRGRIRAVPLWLLQVPGRNSNRAQRASLLRKGLQQD